MERLRALLGRVWRRQRNTSSSTPCDSLRKDEEEVRDEFAQLQGLEENLPEAEKIEENSSWLDPVLPFAEEDSGSSGSVLAQLELPEQDNLGAGLQSGGSQKAKRSFKGLRGRVWKQQRSTSSSAPCAVLRTEDEEEVRSELAQLQSMEEELPAAEAENSTCEDHEVLVTKQSVRLLRHELTRALHQRHLAESRLQVQDMLAKQLQEENVALENEAVVFEEERKAYNEQVMAFQESIASFQKKNVELQEELERRKAKEEDHKKQCAAAEAYFDAVMEQKVSRLQQDLDHALRMKRLSESEVRDLRLVNDLQLQRNRALLEEHKAVGRRIRELEDELERCTAKHGGKAASSRETR